VEPDTIDRDARRAKYREERDKRVRPDGNEQYLEPTGRFASLCSRSSSTSTTGAAPGRSTGLEFRNGT
jgi:hypothetical protein